MRIEAHQIVRLKKRADFLKVAASGKKAAAYGLVLQARANNENSEAPVRVGFTVTKKVGNAVVRNRIKRRLRAVATEVMPGHAQLGTDYVIIGRYAAFERAYDDLLGDLRYVLRKIEKESHNLGTID